MKFYTVRDLRTTPKELWKSLSEEGEIIIMNNGKPTAIMVDVAGKDVEESLKAIRQAKAMISFNSMRAKAAEKGYMSDKEIEEEIKKVRKGE